MSDSGSSSMGGETRMLERRVSNNRADLSGDQQMNYFFAWFNTWSDLQKTDFVPVLAAKMSSSAKDKVNGDLADKMGSVEVSSSSSRPPSLFSCQVKLFHEYFSGWSDDQKNYLVLRLRDLDTEFFAKYEEHLHSGGRRTDAAKDYFEPGVPGGGGIKTSSPTAAARTNGEAHKKHSGSSSSSHSSPLSPVSEGH